MKADETTPRPDAAGAWAAITGFCIEGALDLLRQQFPETPETDLREKLRARWAASREEKANSYARMLRAIRDAEAAR